MSVNIEAVTITVSQAKNAGVVGIVVAVVIALLVIRLMTSVIGRTLTALAMILVVVLLYSQRSQITESVRKCDPQILGLHLKIDDADTLRRCQDLVRKESP